MEEELLGTAISPQWGSIWLESKGHRKQIPEDLWQEGPGLRKKDVNML